MVFLSHNELDKTSINYLNQILLKQNFATWIANEQLLAGDDLNLKIETYIGNCTTFIFCIGKFGVSEQQEFELEVAKKNHKRIVPVLLPNNETKVYHSILDTYTFIDFRIEFKNKIETEKLFRIINGESVNEKTNLVEINKPNSNSKQTTKKAVSVALVKDGHVLIIQRAETQKTGGGLWQLPGGKVESNESTEQSALREINEEVGISINQSKLNFIGDFIDTWVIDSKDDYILMTLFVYFVSKTPVDVDKEFKAHKWVPIQDIFEDKDVIYFGSTSKYLKNIRRYVLTHLPLNQISNFIKDNLKSPKPLPKKLTGISEEATTVIYSFLSLMGFIADRGDYYASSTLSHQLINLLSEWALTDGVIFEAIGNSTSNNLRKNDNPATVAKFKEGLFDHHSNLLGVLSHKLPKALSHRKVADVLIFGKSELTTETLLLIRWDFLANKYQIPSKGLEDIESDIKDIATAKSVVIKRFSESLVSQFEYNHFLKFETQHIGAGSLSLLEGDGPMLRNYFVSVFKLSPLENSSNEINNLIDTINKSTIDYLESIKNPEEIQHSKKRDLNFYMWVSLNHFHLDSGSLLGEQFQGLAEILENSSFEDILKGNKCVDVLLKEYTPITFSNEKSELDHKLNLREEYAVRKN